MRDASIANFAAGMPVADRIASAGVDILPLLKPADSAERRMSTLVRTSGQLQPPCTITGFSNSGASEKASLRLSSETMLFRRATRDVRPSAATYARSASDDVRVNWPGRESS